ncbi:hypothetical protein JAAARDRAFT_182191 [Jaapia argillacea MUCL 33604]|uniref:ER membrane protein complex subunit 1 n=1 Tax=Jaapia argillacea MUCL 33604 TaxID=933084 RepID=A0A067PIR3_9AGAM|nr:hypothetical protein JAAARDRAFT_182191 [Jaapia argillacea MUCL 33604]
MRFLGSFCAIVAAASSFLVPAFALHESEAGLLDWYKPHIGVPITHSPVLSPRFHRSVVVSVSGQGVLSGLSPTDGSIAWRRIFESQDKIVSYKAQGDVVTTLSGPGGSTLRTFDVLTGHLILEERLHSPTSGRLTEPADIGVAVAYSRSNEKQKDLFVLTNGHEVRRVDGSSGELKWAWTAADQSSTTIYTSLLPTPDTLYVIGLTKSFSAYTLHITSLSTTTGAQIQSLPIPSSIQSASAPLISLSLSSPETTPRIAWLEKNSIHVLPLTPSLSAAVLATPRTSVSSKYKVIMDVGLGEKGLFVGVLEDGTGRVFGMQKEGEGDGVKGVWEFSGSATNSREAPSMYTGGVDVDGYPYVARVFWSHALQRANAHVFAPHLADGKGLVTGFTFPFNTGVHGIIAHVALDTAHVSELTVLSRLFVTSSTGNVQLWQQDKLQWEREEGLATAGMGVVEFVDLPVGDGEGSGEESGGGREGFVGRLRRQVVEAQNFPQYLIQFVKRFTSSSSPAILTASTKSNTTTLTRDQFGFHKLLIVATPFGKLYALDSLSGEIVWSSVLGLGWAAEVGGRILPVRLFVLDGKGGKAGAEVLLVAQRRADNTLVDTVVFHVNALTGEDALGVSPAGDVLQGVDVIAGPLVDGYLLGEGDGKVAVLIDEFLQVNLYPDTPTTKESFAKVADTLSFALRTGGAAGRQVMGHQVSIHPDLRDLEKFVAYPTWRKSFPMDETIQSVVKRQGREWPVASLGKVRGDRTTMYKYLNPNLFVVLTQGKGRCGIYVVDGAKGSLVYEASVEAREGQGCAVKATFVENWLVYEYFDGRSEARGLDGKEQTKGPRVVSVEFYEGAGVDDKTKSSEMSSFSNRTLDVMVYEQTYLLPHGVTAITATSTKFGMTVKDIIIANENNQIQMIPRRLLDPRRPKQKPTAAEMEEMLIPYDPLIPDEPKRVLSHNYQVANTQRIITSPALLESTSLVFAYGLDMFFTRVSPSGTFDVLSENFNKLQLVLTIGALALAIVITKPMVRRKRLREKWYQ